MGKSLGAAGSKKQTRLRELVNEKFQETLDEKVEPRLTHIENYVKSKLEEINKRSREIHGFVLGTVKTEIADKLHNASMTVDAIVAVLAESDIKIPDFEQKVDAKKVELNTAYKEKAAKEMQARIDASIAEAQAKKDAAAAATPPTEPPAKEAETSETPTETKPEVPAQG